mgnify:CR=1 FL=1
MELIGANFKENGKVYYFDSNNFNLQENDFIIVETERGLQFAKVINKKYVDEKLIINNLRCVVKKANESDYKKHIKNTRDSLMALNKAIKLAEKYKLNMKFLDASFTFDRNQLMFYFLSDNRVDFRDLAKELASIYKTRIELRQIGVRDKAKEVSGLGLCGRELCCSCFLNDLDSVTINMAKNQNIALNPNKINGLCGRLLCCLKYEDDLYTYNRRDMPNIGDIVNTIKGDGKVISIDILQRRFRVDVPNEGIIELTLLDDKIK